MNSPFKYGLIAGVGGCLWLFAEFALGFHTIRPNIGEYTRLAANVIPLITLFLLLKSRRQAAPDGELTLGQGLAAGLYASFVTGLIVYTFLLAYNQVINPGWMDVALDHQVARLRAAGVSELAVRAQIVAFRQANGPFGLVLRTLLDWILTGVIFSLVITRFLRRSSPAGFPKP